jgi:hypothetical protein
MKIDLKYNSSGGIMNRHGRLTNITVLMTRFYRELDKTNKREALQTAQLETRKTYAHPYYWAAFQLTGSAN